VAADASGSADTVNAAVTAAAPIPAISRAFACDIRATYLPASAYSRRHERASWTLIHPTYGSVTVSTKNE
jgi:hypothetical protein